MYVIIVMETEIPKFLTKTITFVENVSIKQQEKNPELN